MSWFGEDWGISEADSNVASSILFHKPPPIGKLPYTHTVSPKITQKGLSYSERDTYKILSRDNHAAATGAALVEALLDQVEIW